MSKKLLRQLTLARCIPHRPYKLTASQLQVKLEEEGIHVSLRTVQRDLEEMSGMGLFDLTSDERSKPTAGASSATASTTLPTSCRSRWRWP
jgi:predicted DNA-binding transcriptional regulator YafY